MYSAVSSSSCLSPQHPMGTLPTLHALSQPCRMETFPAKPSAMNQRRNSLPMTSRGNTATPRLSREMEAMSQSSQVCPGTSGTCSPTRQAELQVDGHTAPSPACREAAPCAGIDGAALASSAGNKAVCVGAQNQQLKCHRTLILPVTDRVLGLSQSPEVSSQ